MVAINKKSLFLGILLGFANWFWAFIIVGSAYYDFVANTPVERPNVGFYIAMLVVNAILSILVFALYLWKYEQHNPIIPEKWAIDALVLGAIICSINFIFDALVFGMLGRNLIAYFWLESTTGYMYPAIILIIYILAFLIYGKKPK